MSETQEKPKKNDNPRPIRKFFGCLGMIIFLCVGCFGVLVFALPFLTGQMLRNSLAEAAIPKANALLNVRSEIDVSENIKLYAWFGENYGVIWNDDSSEDMICVSAAIKQENQEDFRNNSRLYIDESWVIGASNAYIALNFPNDSLSSSPPMIWCGWGHLETGLHLIEFHLRDSFWGESIHVQQWAIRIGEYVGHE